MATAPEDSLPAAAGTFQIDNPTTPTPRSSTSTLPPSTLSTFDTICLNTSPSFFSLNMGTGIASILLHNLPYNARWIRVLGTIVFVLNVVLFVLISLANVVRYVKWKGVFTAVLRDRQAGMFWGCLPMGLVTIVNMVALVCVPVWGHHWARLALGLWWICVLSSILINFGMLFLMFSRQHHTPDTVAAIWLLPVVASVVTAASGALVAQSLLPFDVHLARATIITSYVIWGTGVPMAMFLITLYTYRLATGGMPGSAALPTIFLPLGPCGQGSYGILIMGGVIRTLAYNHGIGFTISPEGDNGDSMLRVADAVYAGGIVTSLILWGLGLVWYTLATALTIDYAINDTAYLTPRSFSIGWTSYTFPIGVWATATIALAEELDSMAFRVIAMVVSLQVIFQWLYVMIMFVIQAWTGTIFIAPELEKWNGNVPLRKRKRRKETLDLR